MKNKIKPLSRKDEIIVQELGGEVLIYDQKTNKAFCLNETSSLVWEACDGNQSVSEISQSIGKKLNSPANEDIVWLALDQLKKERLIANGGEVVSKFDGMSRREVIRKVGLGTMIALPLVSSLVAPTAVSAQSLTCRVGPPFGTNQAVGCNCNGGGNCNSGICCGASGGGTGRCSATPCPAAPNPVQTEDHKLKR